MIATLVSLSTIFHSFHNNSDRTAHDDRLLKYKPSEYINFG